MESRYLKIDYSDALESKKQILILELESLQMLRRIKSYKVFKNSEYKLKNELKSQFAALKNQINSIFTTFPEYKIEIPQKTHKKNLSQLKTDIEIKDKDTDSIQKELEEIKKKLESLG